MANKRPKKRGDKGGGFWEVVKLAFALGVGGRLAVIVFAAVGIGLFVGGFFLINKEQKKPKDEQSGTVKAVAFVLMGLGAAVGGGLGLPALLGEVSEEI